MTTTLGTFLKSGQAEINKQIIRRERGRERCRNDLFVNPTAFCVTEKHAHYLLIPKKVDTNRVLTL
jgi:hypothetical protein